MRDHSLVEPFAVPEIFVDGFSDHMLHNGVMTCAGFRIQPPTHQHGEPQKVVVVRLVWPVTATSEAIEDAKQAQQTPLFIINGESLKRH